MKHSCPNCGSYISWLVIRRAFKCKACGHHLESNIKPVMSWVLFLMQIPALLVIDSEFLVVIATLITLSILGCLLGYWFTSIVEVKKNAP
jgi:hypothetical protein